jgi:hypothetical protein
MEVTQALMLMFVDQGCVTKSRFGGHVAVWETFSFLGLARRLVQFGAPARFAAL